MELAHPVKRVLNEEVPHLVGLRAVEIDCRAPRRFVALGKIGAEVSKIISLGAEMVIDDVENDRETAPMTGVDEPLEALRPAVGILRGERLNAVIAPIPSAGKLRYRHQLQRCNAQLFEIIEARHNGIERPLRRERADVQLVNEVVFKLGTGPTLVAPVEVAVEDDGRTVYAIGLIARRRIGPLFPVQAVSITRIGLDAVDDRAMVPARLRLERDEA